MKKTGNTNKAENTGMTGSRRKRAVRGYAAALAAVVMLLAAGCGNGFGEKDTTAAAATTANEETAAETETAGANGSAGSAASEAEGTAEAETTAAPHYRDIMVPYI